MLIPDLHNLAIPFLRCHQQLSFARVVAGWFFDINMLPGAKIKNGHRSMPGIGSRDRNRVDVSGVEYVAEVAGSGRGVLQDILGFCRELS